MLNLKTKIIISVVVITTSFASGRFLTPVKTITIEKEVQVEKVEHKKTIITKTPDGKQVTVKRLKLF